MSNQKQYYKGKYIRVADRERVHELKAKEKTAKADKKARAYTPTEIDMLASIATQRKTREQKIATLNPDSPRRKLYETQLDNLSRAQREIENGTYKQPEIDYNSDYHNTYITVVNSNGVENLRTPKVVQELSTMAAISQYMTRNRYEVTSTDYDMAARSYEIVYKKPNGKQEYRVHYGVPYEMFE